MYGDPRSPSPPPSPCEPAGPPCICQGPGPGRRAGRTRRRARPLPNARRAMFRPTTAKAATRPIRRASLPAAPRPSGLPRRHRRARAPRRPWDAGSESGCKFLYALFCSGLAAGDVGLDAQHDAHGEDADDRGDAGGRRVQRELPTLSVPPTKPTSHSQGCAPPT